MKHVVLFSGGVGSWAAAKRVAEKHGTENLTLLFTDTKSEDEDTYRFLREAAENVGGELVWIAEGRDIWQVFEDEKMIGNTRFDPCSKHLKRIPSRKWIHANCAPHDSIIYVGIDWSEAHRYERLKARWLPYRVEAPLVEPPYLTKAQMIAWAESEGIEEQALYREKFAHANCGGFCVKAGKAHLRHLLRTRPDTYLYHEKREREHRIRHGKNVTVVKESQGGVSVPVTLKELRVRWERGESDQETLTDWGGCGCFAGEEA